MPASPPALPDLLAGLPRPVALAGFGVEGRETLRFLLRHGFGEVEVFDRLLAPDAEPARAAGEEFPGIPLHGPGDWGRAMGRCGTLIRSPGVRPDHPGLLAAAEAGVRLTSATELFLAACPGPIVGVTGTLGKGTTVSLIEAALNRAGVPCRSGGNIGLNPLAFVEQVAPREVTVLELSSFQLMGLRGRKPEVAVVLRTTSEHLDWHTGVEEYRAAKRGLLADPGEEQRVAYCADSEGAREVIAGRGEHAENTLAFSRVFPVRDGIGATGGRLFRFRDGQPEPLPGLERLAMPGVFNLENAAAAYLAGEALGGQGGPMLAAIREFPGLPHRLQAVGRIGQVDCFNDSYATRPEATQGAVGAFAGPLALIAGGSEKNADFAPLAQTLCRHASLRRVVLIGATAARLATAIREAAHDLKQTAPDIQFAESLETAVGDALDALSGSGTLLFSPACASFDMFPNYQVRGEMFQRQVARLSQSPG